MTTSERARRKPCRGWTLIELSAAVVISTTILSCVTALLATLLRQDAQGGRALRQVNELARLADRFRSDLHGAIRVETGDADDGTPVVCHLPEERRVKYRLRGDNLVRTWSNKAGEVARDSFPLPRGARARSEQHGNAARPVASLVIEWPLAAAADAKRRRFTIDALVGRNLVSIGMPPSPGKEP